MAQKFLRDLTVVAIYNGQNRTFKELLLVMTQEQELQEDWKSGERLELSEVQYMLGERIFYKKGLIVHYQLVQL